MLTPCKISTFCIHCR